ncbi:family 3 adenylate cyclase [Nitzschia inconspicua]|uniref:Family 3 adenylate cyclase n=1 Tax=Nitzschia inconspicua TaxID=303405 RepID=A0A9K3KYT9_9STRA|nr:family 3 adenylate cyclase [Nitzschia inconspicua]
MTTENIPEKQTIASTGDPKALNTYVETYNSSRDLVISDGSSDGDDDDDTVDANETKQVSGSINISNLNPVKRLLSGEKNEDDKSLVEPEEFAGIEDKVIAKNLRIIVFAIFFTLGIALPIIVYKTMSKNQKESFEGTFRSLSTKVIDVVDVRLARQLTAVDSLRIALTSYALSSSVEDQLMSHSNYLWPYVTLPDWDLRAENVRDMGELLSISLSPVVTAEQRPEWQNYTQENLKWLWETQERQSHDRTRPRKLQRIGSLPNVNSIVQSNGKNDTDDVEWVVQNGQYVSKDIYRPQPSGVGFAVESAQNSPFLPMWTQAPAVSALINLNIFSLAAFGTAAAEAVGTGEVTLSQVYDLAAAGPAQRALLTDYFTLLLRDNNEGSNTTRYDGGPVATLSFPVFDSFDVSQGLVAILMSVIQFQQYFNNVLPGESGAVMAVVSNTCGDVFSYEIDGEVVIYLGEGDLHDPFLEHLGQSCNFSSFADATTHAHGGYNFNKDYCPYSVAVFPTAAMHEQYITSDPEVYAVSIAVVIIVISLISLAYDLIVQRRMKRIMFAAQNRHALLTKLYPSNVREILLREEQEKKDRLTPRRNSNGSFPGTFGLGISSRRSSGDNASVPQESSSGENRRHSNEGPRRNSGDHLISEIFHSGVSGAVSGVNVAVHGVSNVVTGVGTMAGYLLTPLAPSKLRLRFLLKEDDDKESGENTSTSKSEGNVVATERPIADLFPNCTVLFADISGFTAWSSERQPEQVFTLLQEIFQAFDRLATKRNVFKVETIGDCYVAVTGLPDPQPDHAVRMTKFARACMKKCTEITMRLEVTLGPGTGGLRMRFGLHSGPVTAGVLRGEKSRFQLFGDTVNTASRIESTGQRNRIQVSQQTADLLVEAGKENWVVPRKDLVEAKGKGTIQTYWVLTKRRPSTTDETQKHRPKFVPIAPSSVEEDDTDHDSQEGSVWGQDEEEELNESINLSFIPQHQIKAHYERLIDWQVELFSKILVEIGAGRDYSSFDDEQVPDPSSVVKHDGPVFEEVLECIELPKFDPRAARARNTREGIFELSTEVMEELRGFIRTIASRYRQNPFHSYAHASHVIQSANKLLGRIVKPEFVNYRRSSLNAIALDLHDYTYGITSDPLTHFAVLFATLIHDVDHSGVSNGQRGIEEPEMAALYRNKSIAEQNSIDIAWHELSKERYKNLRKCICATEDELRRFRQLIVNLVMATDIFDKDMKELRNRRWNKAFYRDVNNRERTITLHSMEDDRNMRATIVIEHIIQAADVSHCMQHWQVYKRWNERFFQEMYLAYEEGRGGSDPSEGWYNGELWFFDNYIIPLAKKLEECGVFGVSSDECLNYALENRREWAAKGKQIVEEMVQRFRIWRITGQVLENPLLEPTRPQTDIVCNENNNVSISDSSMRFEEEVIEFNGVGDEVNGNDSDDESMIIDA